MIVSRKMSKNVCVTMEEVRKGGTMEYNRSYGKKIIETEKKADAPQTDDAESITDFPVCGNRPSFSCAYLEICGSAACEKRNCTE